MKLRLNLSADDLKALLHEHLQREYNIDVDRGRFTGTPRLQASIEWVIAAGGEPNAVITVTPTTPAERAWPLDESPVKVTVGSGSHTERSE